MSSMEGWWGTAEAEGESPGEATAGVLAGMAAVTRNFQELEETTAPTDLLPGLAEHFRFLGGLQARGDHLHRQLLAERATIALMIAHVYFMLGMREQVQQHLDLGRELATESGDLVARAQAMAGYGRHLYSSASGIRDADDRRAWDCFDAAIQLLPPGTDHQLLIALRILRAEQYALMMDRAGCLMDLAQCRELMARREPISRGLLAVRSRVDLEAVAGNCELILGTDSPTLARAAVDTLERVHTEMPDRHARWRATVQADLGAAHALTGHEDHGAQVLTEALERSYGLGARHNVLRIQSIHRRYFAGINTLATRQLRSALEFA